MNSCTLLTPEQEAELSRGLKIHETQIQPLEVIKKHFKHIPKASLTLPAQSYSFYPVVPWEMKQPRHIQQPPQTFLWPLSPALGDPTLWAAPSHLHSLKTPIALLWIREFNTLNTLFKRDERVWGRNIWNMFSRKSILDCRPSHKQ